MRLRSSPRTWRLAVLLVLLGAAAAWRSFGSTPHAPAYPTRKPTPIVSDVTPTKSAKPADAAMDSDPDDDKIVDIFAIKTWDPPAPVIVAKPEPPPPPQAPPLPFRFFGRITDPDKGPAFLLKRGEDILSVTVGDSIDGIYRVDKFEAGQLQFIYQPLNIRQTLAVGSDS